MRAAYGTCSLSQQNQLVQAGVMELADVLDSKSSGSDTVSVRPRPPAPNQYNPNRTPRWGWVRICCIFHYPTNKSGPTKNTILRHRGFNDFLRDVEASVDFSFVYDKAAHLYSSVGCPSIGPVIIVRKLLTG